MVWGFRPIDKVACLLHVATIGWGLGYRIKVNDASNHTSGSLKTMHDALSDEMTNDEANQNIHVTDIFCSEYTLY